MGTRNLVLSGVQTPHRKWGDICSEGTVKYRDYAAVMGPITKLL